MRLFDSKVQLILMIVSPELSLSYPGFAFGVKRHEIINQSLLSVLIPVKRLRPNEEKYIGYIQQV